MSISLGSTSISDAKLGSSQVSSIYLGTNLVWSSTPPSPGPPSFYSTTFADNFMTPFFAINDGGYSSGSNVWQQWGTISGSTPAQVYSQTISGSGTPTWDSGSDGYTFNDCFVYWNTGNPSNGAWYTGSWAPPGTNWNEQVFALYFQGVIPSSAPGGMRHYIASAGTNDQSQYFGWNLIWTTSSVEWVGGTNTYPGAAQYVKYTSASFDLDTKYNVMYIMTNNAGNHYTNMYYAKPGEPITASITSPYNYVGDGYNWVAYFDCCGNGGARVGKGTNQNVYNEAGYCSASIHSFMMFGGGVGQYFIDGTTGMAASASLVDAPYIQQIFNTASLTF